MAFSAKAVILLFERSSIRSCVSCLIQLSNMTFFILFFTKIIEFTRGKLHSDDHITFSMIFLLRFNVNRLVSSGIFETVWIWLLPRYKKKVLGGMSSGKLVNPRSSQLTLNFELLLRPIQSFGNDSQLMFLASYKVMIRKGRIRIHSFLSCRSKFSVSVKSLL